MKKNVFGRRLRRDTNERKALFKSLMSSLVMSEGIKTTKEKASAIKGQVDKLVTIAKTKDKMLASRLLSLYLTPLAMEKMINDIAPRFANRNGGYTTRVAIKSRVADNAAMVLLTWIEGHAPKAVQGVVVEKDKKAKKQKETVVEAEVVVKKTRVRKGVKKNGK